MACLVFSLNEMPCGVYILMTRVASTNIIHGRNRKNMRRTLIVSWAVAVALCASAQKPQEIKGIVEEAHDSLWYAGQVEAWQREVDADGQDEKAWRNLFEAAWGLKSCSRGKNDGGMPRILERMERAIPETYTYNICAYRASQGPDNKFAEKAMTLLPDDISDRGYDAVLGYLWMMGETDGTGWKAGLFNDILRRQYEHGKYPSFILRFGYNQLQGMAEGGLFFRQRRRGAFRQAHVAACDACAYGQGGGRDSFSVHTVLSRRFVPAVGDSSLSRARGQNGRRVQGGCARDGGIRHPRIRSSGLLFARFAVGRAGHSPQTL